MLICFEEASVYLSDVLKMDLFDLKVGGLRMPLLSRKRGFVVFLCYGESRSFLNLTLKRGSAFLLIFVEVRGYDGTDGDLKRPEQPGVIFAGLF